MSGIRYDIETIMEVIEQSQEEDCYLIITESGVCWIESLKRDTVIEFNNTPDLYRWTAEQQAKLDEKRKEQNDQQAQDHRDSEPTKHRWG